MGEKMIYKKMIGIMNEIDAIGKTKTNTQQNYKFRGIDDMYNTLQPLFKKHGVFILSEVLSEHRGERKTKSGGTLFSVILDMKFLFCAEDGSSVSSIVKGEAMDSGDKATNKAMSTALKYALMQTFLIPTEELKELNTENENYELVTDPVKPANQLPDKDKIVNSIKDLKDKEAHGVYQSVIRNLAKNGTLKVTKSDLEEIGKAFEDKEFELNNKGK